MILQLQTCETRCHAISLKKPIINNNPQLNKLTEINWNKILYNYFFLYSFLPYYSIEKFLNPGPGSSPRKIRSGSRNVKRRRAFETITPGVPFRDRVLK